MARGSPLAHPDRTMRRLFAVLVLMTGCNLYWNGDGDDVVCALAPNQELRNPVTGDCEYFNGPGYPCDSVCGAPCQYEDESIGQPQPDWGACTSQCNGLEEAACLTAPGCLAAYYEDDAPSTTSFRGCYITAPSGPVSTGGCATLGAQECSRHDNCAMYYDAGLDALQEGDFTRCAPEPTTNCALVDCETGSHCEDQCTDPNSCAAMCVPDEDSCAATTCQTGFDCVEVCSGGACHPSCVPVTACPALTTESACAARSDCTTVYNGTDCTCYPNSGCTCEVLTYDHCEAH
jgi:hypothetical protein